MKKHALFKLQGLRAGRFFLRVALGASSKIGWMNFSLSLSASRRNAALKRTVNDTDAKILEGIYSGGGKGIKGWIEIGGYFPIVRIASKDGAIQPIDLQKEHLDRIIFRSLSGLIPPGGHLMFAYEVFYDSPFHEETQRSLRYGIPAVCTAQGELLFLSGFHLIKNWYLAEGGHEGLNKLWGEKPLNRIEKDNFDERSFLQILSYCAAPPKTHILELDLEGRMRGLNILRMLSLARDLRPLREKIMRSYNFLAEEKSSGMRALEIRLESASQELCAFLRRIAPKRVRKDEGWIEQLSWIFTSRSGNC